jgi:hypothetical protein
VDVNEARAEAAPEDVAALLRLLIVAALIGLGALDVLLKTLAH